MFKYLILDESSHNETKIGLFVEGEENMNLIE
jgi:hypothetical protein